MSQNEYIDDKSFDIFDVERDEDVFVKNWGEGICCFCGDECNPMSQDCGCWRRGYRII